MVSRSVSCNEVLRMLVGNDAGAWWQLNGSILDLGKNALDNDCNNDPWLEYAPIDGYIVRMTV